MNSIKFDGRFRISDALTVLYKKSGDGGYVGQLKEEPAVISQGRDLSELVINLEDALKALKETEMG